MSQLEAWQRVYVKDTFISTTHGQLGCIACHKGNPDAEDKTQAHVDLVPFPSEQADVYCGTCHSTQASGYHVSLHYSQEGYYTRFENRSGFDLRQTGTGAMKAGYAQDCGGCHTTCGECHVSRPRSVNGGFISSHVFNATPNLTNNCTACHGSRIGEEYSGTHEGLQPDVHFTYASGVLKCEDCHSGSELHGDGTQYYYRYDDNYGELASCQDCHLYDSENRYHRTHWDGNTKLACQVCHSQPYKNCNGCHAKGSADQGGITSSSYLLFKIGKNYMKSDKRPYDYIPVRHIPIVPDTYKNWGLENLDNFTSLPTWKYATPHNIQRWTAQTDTTGGKNCFSACHNNDDILLKQDDLIIGITNMETGVVEPTLQGFQNAEEQANQEVIIP